MPLILSSLRQNRNGFTGGDQKLVFCAKTSLDLLSDWCSGSLVPPQLCPGPDLGWDPIPRTQSLVSLGASTDVVTHVYKHVGARKVPFWVASMKSQQNALSCCIFFFFKLWFSRCFLIKPSVSWCFSFLSHYPVHVSVAIQLFSSLRTDVFSKCSFNYIF